MNIHIPPKFYHSHFAILALQHFYPPLHPLVHLIFNTHHNKLKIPVYFPLNTSTSAKYSKGSPYSISSAKKPIQLKQKEISPPAFHLIKLTGLSFRNNPSYKTKKHTKYYKAEKLSRCVLVFHIKLYSLLASYISFAICLLGIFKISY